jgi:predicted CoA-binding protein
MVAEQKILEFPDQKNAFAVVGVSKDPQKYGHQIYRDLRTAELIVYPINPTAIEVLGDKCYPTIEALPVKPDVVDTVIPPKITEGIVKTCEKLGINKVWMQPGSESDVAIDFCKQHNLEVIYGICIMQERRRRNITGHEK